MVGNCARGRVKRAMRVLMKPRVVDYETSSPDIILPTMFQVRYRHIQF